MNGTAAMDRASATVRPQRLNTVGVPDANIPDRIVPITAGKPAPWGTCSPQQAWRFALELPEGHWRRRRRPHRTCVGVRPRNLIHEYREERERDG
jgi:hypothetical protein